MTSHNANYILFYVPYKNKLIRISSVDKINWILATSANIRNHEISLLMALSYFYTEFDIKLIEILEI